MVLTALLPALLLGALAVWADPARGDRALLALLRTAPGTPTCGHRWAQWGALVRDEADRATDACFEELATTPLERHLLARLARDDARPWPTRLAALTALAGAPGDDQSHLTGGPTAGPTGRTTEGPTVGGSVPAAGDHLPQALVVELLLAPRTPPSLRHELLALLARRPDGPRWADLAREAPVHGAAERGTLTLAGLGEPGLERAAARAGRLRRASGLTADLEALLLSALDLTERDLRDPVHQSRLPLGDAQVLALHPCGQDCVEAAFALLAARHRRSGGDDPPPQPPLAVGDDAVDALAGDPEAADALRGAVHALAAWVALAPPEDRLRRLRLALAHPAADPLSPERAWASLGAPGATLDAGTGSPGSLAFLAEAVGVEAGLEVELHLASDTVRVRVGDTPLLPATCAGLGPPASLPAAAGTPDNPAASAGSLDPSATAAGASTGSPLPPGSGVALTLAEAIGAALRAGDPALARARADALPRGALGLAPVRDAAAVAFAASGGWPPPTPDSLQAPATAGVEALLAGALDLPGVLNATRLPTWSAPPLSEPPRRGRRGPRTRTPPVPPPPAPAAPAPPWAYARASAALVADASPEARLWAAWWAAEAGHTELARASLAGLPDLPAALAPWRAALSARLDEPGAHAEPPMVSQLRCPTLAPLGPAR